MRKLFLFFLIGCMCLCMVACGDKPNETTGTDGSVTASKPDASFPGSTTEVLEYLSNKYGGTFFCDGFTHDNTTFHCSGNGMPIVLVHTVESLIEDGYDAVDFTGKYADNGYIQYAHDEIQDYYAGYFSEMENFMIHVYMTHEVFPSDVTAAASYETNRKAHPDYFTPELYILYDGDVDEAVMKAAQASLQTAGEHVTVRVVKVNESRWTNVTVDELVWKLDDFEVLYQFSVEGAA